MNSVWTFDDLCRLARAAGLDDDDFDYYEEDDLVELRWSKSRVETFDGRGALNEACQHLVACGAATAREAL